MWRAMSEGQPNQVRELLTKVLAPLVEKDGGRLYLVELDDSGLKLHLAGTYGGCPGTPLIVEQVLVPPLRQLNPSLSVEVSRGWQVPDGATSLHQAKP